MPLQIPSDITVALVEDEPELSEEIAFQLRHSGFAVETFTNAAAIYRYLLMHSSNTIVVLDIGLAGEDGISICQYLRNFDNQIGIIFLTARGFRDDRLIGLAAGADAYLVKPVDMEELVLVLRRLALRYADLTENQTHSLRHADVKSWKITPDCYCLTAPNGIQINLTVIESQLIRVLTKNPRKVCSYVELGAAINSNPDDLDKHRIEVIISRLRAKVERKCGISLPLRSHRSVGYSLSETVDGEHSS